LSACSIHKNFFDDKCPDCKLEYAELKGLNQTESLDNEKSTKLANESIKKSYKEFSEERAKKLYEELMIQYMRTKSLNEVEAARRARQIIRKQCVIRGIEIWNWLKTE
jgi:polyhydroxyalkanoate synthesis regulator phasin